MKLSHMNMIVERGVFLGIEYDRVCKYIMSALLLVFIGGIVILNVFNF